MSRLLGVPCGIVTETEMTSASTEGKKWNVTNPPSTKPRVTTSIDHPQRDGQIPPPQGELKTRSIRSVNQQLEAVGEEPLESLPGPTAPAPRLVREVRG